MKRLFLWLCVLLAGELDGSSVAASLPIPGRHPEAVIHTSPLPTPTSQGP